MLTASAKYLTNWKLATQRQRFDYDSPDHLIADMQHEHYWSTVMADIEPGDLIHVTDAASEGQVIRIDWKNSGARTVGFSLVERVTEKPVATASGYTIKNRGGRGGMWCVFNAAGEIVMRDLRNQDEATRHMLNLTEKAA